MKKTLIIATIVAAAASQASAQSLPPSEELAAQFYTETGQLRVALGQAQSKINAQAKRIAELEAQIAKAEESASKNK